MFRNEADDGPIRVVVVDDLEAIRTLVREMVEDQPDMAVVGEAPNGREGVADVCRLRPDVVVMDGDMPIMCGAQATACLTRLLPAVSVVAFSSSPAMADAMLASGARAKADKRNTDELVPAIRRVLADRVGRVPRHV